MIVAILLFTSPVQHENSTQVLEIARALKSAGHRVRIFLLGDGVYNASAHLLSNRVETVVAEMQSEGLEMTACTTCATYRGVDRVITGSELGTLEDFTEIVEGCDILLNFTSEG